jgi:hypothetical protein
MKWFSLCQIDQRRPTWVLFERQKKLPPDRPPLETIPFAVHALLGAAVRGQMSIKDKYLQLCCRKCGRYDSYAIFNIGFDEDVSVRISGDFGHSNDRIFLVNEKFLSAIRQARVKGFETKPLGRTGWHAFRITVLVESSDTIVKTSGPACLECGTPEEAWGVHERETDLSLPETSNTFFTTLKSWPSFPFQDRPIFLTDDVVRILQDAGVAGGYCYRLWTEEEARRVSENRKRGIDRYPGGTTVYLSGRRRSPP